VPGWRPWTPSRAPACSCERRTAGWTEQRRNPRLLRVQNPMTRRVEKSQSQHQMLLLTRARQRSVGQGEDGNASEPRPAPPHPETDWLSADWTANQPTDRQTKKTARGRSLLLVVTAGGTARYSSGFHAKNADRNQTIVTSPPRVSFYLHQRFMNSTKLGVRRHTSRHC